MEGVASGRQSSRGTGGLHPALRPWDAARGRSQVLRTQPWGRRRGTVAPLGRAHLPSRPASALLPPDPSGGQGQNPHPDGVFIGYAIPAARSTPHRPAGAFLGQPAWGCERGAPTTGQAGKTGSPRLRRLSRSWASLARAGGSRPGHTPLVQAAAEPLAAALLHVLPWDCPAAAQPRQSVGPGPGLPPWPALEPSVAALDLLLPFWSV